MKGYYGRLRANAKAKESDDEGNNDDDDNH